MARGKQTEKSTQGKKLRTENAKCGRYHELTGSWEGEVEEKRQEGLLLWEIWWICVERVEEKLAMLPPVEHGGRESFCRKSHRTGF